MGIKLSGQIYKPPNLPYYDQKFLHFGFTIGLNRMDFKIQRSEEMLVNDSIHSLEVYPQMGFNLNAISDIRIGKYLNLRFLPGLNFGQRNLQYVVIDEKEGYTNYIMRLESIFLDIPVLVKYKAKRINNYRPYIIGGMAYRWDLATRRKLRQTEDFRVTLEPMDMYFEIGFGIDFYFYYFKFSTELKASLGYFDVLSRDGSVYTNVVERMSSNMVSLNFHFE